MYLYSEGLGCRSDLNVDWDGLLGCCGIEPCNSKGDMRCAGPPAQLTRQDTFRKAMLSDSWT